MENETYLISPSMMEKFCDFYIKGIDTALRMCSKFGFLATTTNLLIKARIEVQNLKEAQHE